MPKKKEPKEFPRRSRPALTPEVRENQLIALAIDRVEQQLLDCAASQTNPIETYSFPMSGKYATKNIELTVSADVVLTVTLAPSEKTSIIYNSSDGKYYLWR